MKTVRHCAVIVFLVALCAAFTFADEPGRHPAYLHALTDLRHARAHLENLAPTYHMDKEEEHAINEIDKAIDEIKRAAIDDGKNLNDHPPVDARMDRAGRFHRAMELLEMNSFPGISVCRVGAAMRGFAPLSKSCAGRSECSAGASGSTSAPVSRSCS